ncbi:MAG: DNA ligase [Desulfurivibrionaceae bacterium]|nr:DNA ligase [Desulfurivibrionaceae bacterium]
MFLRPERRERRPLPLILSFLAALLLGCGLLPGQAPAAGPMLPLVYEEHLDVDGWLMSEKLDGVRGYWDGHHLWTKNGHLLAPLPAFIQGLPSFALEGELWGGRGTFEQTLSIVKKEQPHDGWLQLKFAIFDVPREAGGFTRRLEKACTWFASHPSDYAFVIPQTMVSNRDHLRQELQRIEEAGGEGLMVRRPDAPYVAGRSADIRKVKSFQDAEAKVVGHLPGKGRNSGRLGSLLVELADGTRFKIGSGFTDQQRQAPPAMGAVVTFKFYGKYRSGIPRFPSFLRLRTDPDL